MKKSKAKRGKAKTGIKNKDEEELKGCPHSFVFNRGRVGKHVGDLVMDMRRVMEPFTAKNLKVRSKNVLKDFVNVAGPLNVSHFVVFTKSENSTNLRLIRLPRGPTLTFQVKNFCLSRDVISSLKKRVMDPKAFQHHALLVMNNFRGDGMHIKLMQTMFQNMFPAINVNKVRLKTIRRCVLLSYNAETKEIDFRHYNIRAVPSGVSRSVKKLIKAKVPNLARYDDVSEFFTRGDVSESEGELDGAHNEVVLPQSLPSRGNMASQKSAIRLNEIGPRLTLQLVKIEEGVAEGAVLYHEFIHKTEEEMLQNARSREKKKKLKAERKKQQQKNIEAKKKEKETQQQRSLAGMQDSKDGSSPPDNGNSDTESDTREDIEYFKHEVGEAPEPELFPKHKGRRKPTMKRKSSTDRTRGDKSAPAKKVKFSSQIKSKHSNSGDKAATKIKKSGKVQSEASSEKEKKKLTAMDRLRRSKGRKEKRARAKRLGKRANKPRKC